MCEGGYPSLNMYQFGLCLCILFNVFSITVGSSVFPSLICYWHLVVILSSTVCWMLGLHISVSLWDKARMKPEIKTMKNTKNTSTRNYHNKTSALQTNSKGPWPHSVTGPPASHSVCVSPQSAFFHLWRYEEATAASCKTAQSSLQCATLVGAKEIRVDLAVVL